MSIDVIKSYLSKCRMCLKNFQVGDKHVFITRVIEERFLVITQMKLKESKEELSSIICETCDNELRNIQAFRRDLILKQRKLLKFVENAKSCESSTAEKEELNSSDELFDDSEEDDSLESEGEQIEESEMDDDDGEEERYEKFKVRKYFCDICGSKSLIKSNLAAHMTSHLPSIKQESLKLEPDLRIHRPAHKPTKMFQCPCGKEFKYHSQFVDHSKRVHENIRDYSCQFCGKNYYTRRELSVHIKRSHMKGPEEAVYCEICGKIYASKHSLRTHKKYHEQPQFVCSFEGCGKAFIGRQMLVNHEKIHLGQRDHMCHLCDKTFFSASHMRRHIAVAHQNLKIDCVVEGCQYANGRKDYLRTHLLTCHKELHEDVLNQYLLQVREMKIPS